MDLKKFGVAGRVIPTPGHKHGSVSVIMPGGGIIVGDTIMRSIFRWWQPNYPLFADDISQLKEGIKLILHRNQQKSSPPTAAPSTPSLSCADFRKQRSLIPDVH